jgi:hypothetical protein
MGEKLTNINKLRNPNYIGGWDLQNDRGETINRIVTIKEVKQGEAFNQAANGMTVVLTVHFHEVKPLILNATNRKTIVKVTGTEFIELMPGKKIELTTKKLKAFGEMHDAVRIVNRKITENTTAQPSTPAPAPIQVDEAACIAKLNAAQTLQELASIYSSLAQAEKSNAVVIKRKDELKAKFTDGSAQ